MKGVDVIYEKREQSTKTEQPFGNSENQLPRASLFGAPKTRAREKQDEI